MIKVYLDWNIMSSMKQEKFIELKMILDNQEKFLLVYSTSHIGDILTSHSEEEHQKKIIQEDLEYITSITNNQCFFNDGKNIQLGFMDPIEMYDDRLESQNLFNNFSIDSLFSSFEDDEILAPLVGVIKNLIKSTPLDSEFKKAFDDPKSAGEMEKMFPGLKDDLSFEGWFKYFGEFYTRLNETEDYKRLRETVQRIGVNSGHFNQDKNPFDVINTSYKKLGVENSDTNHTSNSNENAPIWFNEISNEYIMLDMHGYRQDKIKVNAKEKNTFRNTTDDAFHSAFASRCDFYITNDKKNIDKTKAVYSKYEIETSVFTPEEFTQYYKDYLNFNSFSEHMSNFIDVLKTGKNYYDNGNETDENGKPLCFVGFSNHYFFNFFNKVRICESSKKDLPYYLISRNYLSRIHYISLQEIEKIVYQLTNSLGIDNDEKGYYISGEIQGEYWEGRNWTLENWDISLKRLNGWFQLYFYPKKQKKKFMKVISSWLSKLRLKK